MQQTFPAGTAQRIVINKVRDNLSVYGWDQQTIQVDASGQIEQLQPEGDALIITASSDSLKLHVPFETIIIAHSVRGDAKVEGVRQVDLMEVSGDVGVKHIGGNVSLTHIHGDTGLNEIDGDVTLTDIEGDLMVKNVPVVRVGNRVAGDVAFMNVARVEIDKVESDLLLDGVEEATVGNVKGDLNVKSGIVTLNCSNVGNDCQIVGDGNAEVKLGNVGNDCTVSGVSRLQATNVGAECQVQGNANVEISIGHIGSELAIVGASNVSVGNIGSECTLRDVQGDVTLGHIGSDARITGVGGSLRTGTIGSDAHLKGLHGDIQVGNIGNNLLLQADFPAGSSTRLVVGNDARILLPEEANLTIHANVGGHVSGRSVVSNSGGNAVNLVYGDGSARLDLSVGNDLKLGGEENPRSSSSSSEGWDWDWSDFGREMSNFGREMERMGSELGREISAAVQEATSSIGAELAGDFTRAAEHKVRHAQRYAEEQRRKAEERLKHFEREQQRRMEQQQRKAQEIQHKAEERAQRYAREQQHRAQEHARRALEHVERINVRINDREWRMDSDRLERILEQARLAAAEGIQGALDAVEQALSNLHIPVPPTPPSPPAGPEMPPAPPTPPYYGGGVPPMPPAPPAPPAPPTEHGAKAPSVQPEIFANEQAVQEHLADEITPEASPKPQTSNAPVNPAQEREAILRMIAEGRITPEEGDMLLEALGS